MELLDKETIFGIVESGKYNRSEAATLQGAPLTKEQREWWREATILKKANAERAGDRAEKLDRLMFGGGPMSGAERARKFAALHASIDELYDDAVTRINKARRRKAEKSLLEFVKAYGTDEGSFLERKPAKLMESILDEMQTAIDDSSVPYHIRIARGHGKTSYAKLACAWAAATGRRKFIVVIGSNSANANNIVQDVFGFMCDSPKFCQDFPEISVPFGAIGGVFQRAKSQTYRGKPTNAKVGGDKIVLPTIEGAKSSGCILKSAGFATHVRGLVSRKQRPDLLVLDDLQSDDLAGNEDRVLAAIAYIHKSLMNLAGHNKKIATLMTSTPIEPDDLSEQFSRDPNWKTTTYKMVMSWPKCWKPDDQTKDLWGRYRDILQREITAGNKKPHVPANDFYKRHRAEMDDGAVVLNPDNYDRKTELSAIQHAVNIIIRDGEAHFESEYQMAPRRHAYAFEITAEKILHRVRKGWKPLTRPDGTELVVAATDINPSYALTTAITCYTADRTAFVTFYKVTKIRIDDSENDTAYHQHVYDAICAHARELQPFFARVGVDWWGIDAAGKQIKPVTQFVQNDMATQLSGAKNAVALIGHDYKSWRDNPKKAVRTARNFTVNLRGDDGRRYTFWNADYYKETMQKSFETETGGPGGLSLFDGGFDHTKFAVQVSNERLKVKRCLANGLYEYKWKTREPHDYGDCLAMCYAMAGMNGISDEGKVVSKKHKREVYNG